MVKDTAKCRKLLTEILGRIHLLTSWLSAINLEKSNLMLRLAKTEAQRNKFQRQIIEMKSVSPIVKKRVHQGNLKNNKRNEKLTFKLRFKERHSEGIKYEKPKDNIMTGIRVSE